MDRDLDLWFKPAKTGRPHLGITRLQEVRLGHSVYCFCSVADAGCGFHGCLSTTFGWTFRFTSRSTGGAVPRPESECPFYALFDGGTLDLCAGEEAGGGERLRDKPGAERAQQGQSGPCVAGSDPVLT